MKPNPPPPTLTPASLKTVLDRLAGNSGLSDRRGRDLRSAVTRFAKLQDRPPEAIPLDLAAIRSALDRIVPGQAKVSRKSKANLRSNLAAAVEASGLRPMLKTRSIGLDAAWSRLLAPADQRIRLPLSRFGRWTSLRGIKPEAVDDSVIDRFITELDATTLVRDLRGLHRTVTMAWNALVRLHEGAGLRAVAVPPSRFVQTRIPWQQLPGSFQDDVKRYLTWASVPDPLAENARARALAPLSLRLQQTHIHSAASAAAAAGIPVDQITSLASLVEPETFRAIPAASLARGRTQVVRLHAWAWHHPDRDCLGMGQGVPGCNCDSEESAEQARNIANRLD